LDSPEWNFFSSWTSSTSSLSSVWRSAGPRGCARPRPGPAAPSTSSSPRRRGRPGARMVLGHGRTGGCGEDRLRSGRCGAGSPRGASGSPTCPEPHPTTTAAAREPGAASAQMSRTRRPRAGPAPAQLSLTSGTRGGASASARANGRTHSRAAGEPAEIGLREARPAPA
jgi:hypothetical protein